VDARATTAALLFALTYALISARRLGFIALGRPAAALVGATLMVAAGIVTPEEAYTKAIDGNTIFLLLGMMIITEHLKEAGFFSVAASFVFRVAKTPKSLLVVLGATSGVLSALLVNDTVCLLLTPLVVEVLARTKLPRFPYLMALATSSNVGSVMTLVGNPQNMIIGSLAERRVGLDYVTFAARMVPVGIVCLLLHVGFLRVVFARAVPECWPARAEPKVAIDRPLLTRALLVVFAVSVAFCLRLNPAWSAVAGACALFVWNRQKPAAADVLARLDWSLLLFFAGLFIAVYGLETSGVKDAMWGFAEPLFSAPGALGKVHFVWLSVIGSNVVSNVPFIKLVEGQVARFADPTQGYLLLSMATTFAGNLTLLGSVANIIVLEQAREPIGFFQYLRVGLPATLLTCAAGTALLLAYT
jgi:Na+/H+ antiporter NhaD/arsenite permease-like protein